MSPPFQHDPRLAKRPLLPFLRCHPDQAFSKYIFESLTWGFRIGFDRRYTLRGNHQNHPSANPCPLAVTTRITSEVQRGCLIGPLPGNLASLVHVSPIGLVPKPHSTNFRMIVDLSSPHGFSVNEGIQRLCAPFSMHQSTRPYPLSSAWDRAPGL